MRRHAWEPDDEAHVCFHCGKVSRSPTTEPSDCPGEAAPLTASDHRMIARILERCTPKRGEP
jgi:hypothetical protein